MSEQNESRAEKARERFLAKQKQTNEKKSISPLPIAIGIAVFFALLAILSATYIANFHREISEQNATLDYQTMTKIGNLDWDSSMRDAPIAVVFCNGSDFAVPSTRAISSDEVRFCSYKTATDIIVEPIGSIWSTSGRVRFYLPE